MAQDVPHHAKQASFPGMCPVEEALESLAESGSEERGAIFTRCEVVEFILDLVGYTASRPLHKLRLLEPAFGDGDFLLLAIGRLLTAWKSATGRDDPVDALSDAIRAVELHGHTFAATREKVLAALKADGIAGKAAVTLVDHWLINADFLLTPLPHSFHCVVGNPPYVRQELIPDALLAEYRTRYSTVFDRADLYVPFIERSLTCLESGGALGFICADRWIKNRYGGPLRKLIADRFHLRAYVDMVETPAFHTDVSAYPAIMIIGNEQRGKTRVARRPDIKAAPLKALSQALLSPDTPAPESGVQELAKVATGGKNMDGFLALVVDIVRANGLEQAQVHQQGRVLTLPGYFRPTKLWDLLVMNEGRLIAALEFKSHVGPSFGNNANNRAEESIGTAHDFWTAYREGAFGEQPRPFAGWMMLLEDTPQSRAPVRDMSPNFPVFKEFSGASYAERYNILCRKLIQERLYTVASVIVSPRTAVYTGAFGELSELTGLRTFVTELAGHVAAEAARA